VRELRREEVVALEAVAELGVRILIAADAFRDLEPETLFGVRRFSRQEPIHGRISHLPG
jgi:hypothetical protein